MTVLISTTISSEHNEDFVPVLGASYFNITDKFLIYSKILLTMWTFSKNQAFLDPTRTISISTWEINVFELFYQKISTQEGLSHYITRKKF